MLHLDLAYDAQAILARENNAQHEVSVASNLQILVLSNVGIIMCCSF